MPQPVHGDIGIEAGIIDDAGKVEDEKQPQRHGRQGPCDKESYVLAQKLEHGSEYSA
jgi:hypothetical protein